MPSPVSLGPDLVHEVALGREDGRLVAGVDEVGRGPLAGPVVACAVILPPAVASLASGITDSKLLTARRRELLAPTLCAICQYGLGEASVEEIDRLNILQATFLAMRRAVEALGVIPHHVLVDGPLRPPDLPCPATALVDGDLRSLSIAAASIIAKVTRDRQMRELALRHPGYGWEKNAGYGTRAHLLALHRLGPTPHHRRSFAPVRHVLESGVCHESPSDTGLSGAGLPHPVG